MSVISTPNPAMSPSEWRPVNEEAMRKSKIDWNASRPMIDRTKATNMEEEVRKKRRAIQSWFESMGQEGLGKAPPSMAKPSTLSRENTEQSGRPPSTIPKAPSVQSPSGPGDSNPFKSGRAAGAPNTRSGKRMSQAFDKSSIEDAMVRMGLSVPGPGLPNVSKITPATAQDAGGILSMPVASPSVTGATTTKGPHPISVSFHERTPAIHKPFGIEETPKPKTIAQMEIGVNMKPKKTVTKQPQQTPTANIANLNETARSIIRQREALGLREIPTNLLEETPRRIPGQYSTNTGTMTQNADHSNHISRQQARPSAIDESWQRQLAVFAAWDREHGLALNRGSLNESTKDRTGGVPGMALEGAGPGNNTAKVLPNL